MEQIQTTIDTFIDITPAETWDMVAEWYEREKNSMNIWENLDVTHRDVIRYKTLSAMFELSKRMDEWLDQSLLDSGKGMVDITFKILYADDLMIDRIKSGEGEPRTN